jgi:DNA-binding SARP family transcriptional activator
MIVCRTLGPIEVLVDEVPAKPELLWRKHLALLIYLARSAPHGRTREHLMGLLWPDKPDSAARHSLNEAIRLLRRYTGDQSVQTAAERIRLSPGAVQLDLDQLAAYAQSGKWQAAAALVSGEFMEGFSVPGASEFEDWLATEREHWRAQSVVALTECADELERVGRPDEGAGYASRALLLDPRSEHTLRSAMRCLALAGDRPAALLRYSDFCDRLAKDLKMQPDRETSGLAERIRGDRTGRPPPAARAVSGPAARPPLASRETELARLLAAAAEFRGERRAAVLVVEGDVGNGKSRLLEELTDRLRLHGGTVVLARAVEADRDDAYGGILALARGGLLEAPGIAGASPKALGAFARIIPEWEARYPGTGEEGEPLPLRRAAEELLRAAAEERPLVVVVDDAHWLDRESALVFGAALRGLDTLPFAVVLGIQPRWPRPELDEIRSRIGRELAGVAVSLMPLGRDGLVTLARHFLPRYSEVELDRVVRRVATDSAGVPFLAVELLRAVAQGLDLGRVTGSWPEPLKTLDQTLPGDLPDSIVAALRISFRRLSSRAQAVLTAAAVLGDRADAQLLAHVTEHSQREVEAALDELEWHQWLLAEPRGYSFSARLAREVIRRDMVTPGQRQRLLAAVRANT